MDDPNVLRDRARRWRKFARDYDDATAEALNEAARIMDDRAAALEARQRAPSLRDLRPAPSGSETD
jgi:hypothetical protein